VSEQSEPKSGDPCPQCGGEFIQARQLTADERRQLADREQPPHFSGFVDTGDARLIAKRGPLAKCGACGYQTRFAPDAAGASDEHDDTGDDSAAAPEATTAGRGRSRSRSRTSKAGAAAGGIQS
jgi:hypothetical protein